MKASISPSGKLLCLWNAKAVEAVHERQTPIFFGHFGRCKPSSPSIKEHYVLHHYQAPTYLQYLDAKCFPTLDKGQLESDY